MNHSIKNTLKVIIKYSLISLLFTSQIILAAPVQQEKLAHDVYTFTTPQQEIIFNDTLKNLRCLVCQNQDLDDSQAQFAQDLRQDIYQQILHGKSQKAILTSLTSDYGDFILFHPPVKKVTYILWYAPFVLLILGIFFLLLKMHKK